MSFFQRNEIVSNILHLAAAAPFGLMVLSIVMHVMAGAA
jgi:hypothetical protein